MSPDGNEGFLGHLSVSLKGHMRLLLSLAMHEGRTTQF